MLHQLPESKKPLQAYANYAIGPPQVSFSFRVEPGTNLSIYVGVCYAVCFLFSGSPVDATFSSRGSNIAICITTAPQSIPVAGKCPSW